MKRALFGVLLLCAGVFASSARADVALESVADVPNAIYVVSPKNDSRLFIATKDGKIYVQDGASTSLFFDMSALVSTAQDRGLMSLAFAPDYAATGHFYVNFTGVAGDGGANEGDIHVDEFTDLDVSDDSAAGAPRRRLLRIPHDLDPSHNGGTIQFNPVDNDGLLWVSVGDGGVGRDGCHNAQTISSVAPISCSVNQDPLLGKILRINPNVHPVGEYSAAPGQPFTTGSVTAKPEIFAYGLRNPYRFSFDRLTGDLLMGDVGEDDYEELDFVPHAQLVPGLNFGWNTNEGLHPFAGGAPLLAGSVETKPVYEYSHAVGCATSGGYVVRDPSSALNGQTVFGDFCEGKILAGCTSASGVQDVRDLGLPAANITSFGEDASGRIYVVRAGNVSRIVATGDEGSCPDLSGPGPGDTSTGPSPSPTLEAKPAPKPAAFISKIKYLVRQAASKHGYVTVTATCDSACSMTARGTFKIAGAKHTLKTKALKRSLRKNKATTLKVLLTSSARKAVARGLAGGHRVTATVTLSVPGAHRAVARLTITG